MIDCETPWNYQNKFCVALEVLKIKHWTNMS